MEGRREKKWRKKNKSVGQIRKMYKRTEKVWRLQSCLSQENEH